MTTNTWISLVTYSDRVSADVALGLLTGEGVAAYIESDAFVPGLGSNFSIFVTSDQADQAERLLRRSAVSEQELTELALAQPVERSDGEP